MQIYMCFMLTLYIQDRSFCYLELASQNHFHMLMAQVCLAHHQCTCSLAGHQGGCDRAVCSAQIWGATYANALVNCCSLVLNGIPLVAIDAIRRRSFRLQ